MSYFKAIRLTHNSHNGVTETILKVVNENKPQTVKQLTILLEETLELSESEILEAVLKLQARGEIKLEEQNHNSPNLAAFTIGKGLWYLLTIAAGAVTASLVFTIPENFYPWIYIRNFLGLIFVLFLPGYALAKALFPINLSGKTTSVELETIQRIALSVGLSIALISIVGLLLYYSPWGLSLPAIVISLFILTAVFATAGIVRTTNK
jgi:uncharacterized membrane protein